MDRLRDIFRSQYIEAIVIALLVSDALSHGFQVVENFVAFALLTDGANSLSALNSPARLFPWDRVINQLVALALAAFVAYVLYLWVYSAELESSRQTLEAGQSEESNS